MAEKLTIKEIAKLCGISVSTVSRAINNHYDINPETKKKVQEVIDKYGYVPNSSARNLKLNDSRNVAVLVKGITNPFFTSMLKIFEAECSRHEYSLVLQHVEDQADEVDVAASLEKEKRLNGIIFLGGNPMESREKLSKIQAPYVFCSIAVSDKKAMEKYSYVAIDDRKEARKLVNYLIKAGRKRIAILSAVDTDESIGSLRLAGYCDALGTAGIAVDPSLIVRPDNPETTYTHENGYEGIQKLLKSKTPFDAVFAISDSIAVGATRALRDSGLRVPEDVAVAGFDGLDLTKYLVPSLTTLEQPVEKMAYESATALFDAIQDPEAEKHHVIYEGDLRVREST